MIIPHVICCVDLTLQHPTKNDGCRHHSKFQRSVQDEAVKNKAAHRTMGPAKVQTKPPDQFLKKHEKDPKMPQSKLLICRFILTPFVAIFDLNNCLLPLALLQF